MVLDARLQRHVENAARQQRTLDRVRWPAPAQEVLDPNGQLLQKRGARWRRQVEKRRNGSFFSFNPCGERRVIDVAVEEEYGGTESIAVLDDVGDGAAREGGTARRRHEMTAVRLDIAD